MLADRLGLVSAAAIALLLVASGSVRAELDLTLVRSGDAESYLKPTLQVDTGLFHERNAWFGESRENAGDHVGFWSEIGVMPGLEGQLSLDGYGTLRGRVSGVFTTTQFGLDAAGSNFDDRHPSQLTLEDAYVGWSSGDLFPSLGEDAIDFSVGSQRYQVGNGFLFWDGATDGGPERGGYWLSMRKAFEMTAIARLRTGSFMGEVVYLKPNDAPDSSTDVVGTNLEWSFGERAKLGGGYWYFADSEILLRDGLHVFDVRGEVRPLSRLPGLALAGELVYEKNGRLNESWGGYVEVGHAFEEIRGSPYVSYRFASFTGNRGELDRIEGFDPIFFGFSDWGSWYHGEVFGEFIGTNRNLDVHLLRLRGEPAPGWTVQLLGFLFRLDELATDLQPRLFEPRIVNIRNKNLGYEVDLVVDWKMNDHLTWSAVCGTLIPSKGLEQATGGDSVWTHFMVYASVSL
jgi:hypothetical protein